MISSKSTKILWAAAAGRCSFTDCWERLCLHEASNATPFLIGEMAHIRGDKPGSNRHDPSQPTEERDDYSNLILLCPTHHRLIDRKENERFYSVEMLHEMKKVHEAKILEKLDNNYVVSRIDVAEEILTLLGENHESWAQYGPQSEIARREPHNEQIHAVWISERLSIIVPTNRIISKILRRSRNVFLLNEQKSISAFLIHVRSYEGWVYDEIPYSAVVRFPLEFKSMLENITHASV